MCKHDDTRKTNSGAEWRAIVYMLFPRDGRWYACRRISGRRSCVFSTTDSVKREDLISRHQHRDREAIAPLGTLCLHWQHSAPVRALFRSPFALLPYRPTRPSLRPDCCRLRRRPVSGGSLRHNRRWRHRAVPTRPLRRPGCSRLRQSPVSGGLPCHWPR